MGEPGFFAISIPIGFLHESLIITDKLLTIYYFSSFFYDQSSFISQKAQNYSKSDMVFLVEKNSELTELYIIITITEK